MTDDDASNSPGDDGAGAAVGAAGLARFLRRVGRLKRLPRTGWLDRGVPPADTESVADHSFRTALLAWLAAAGRPDLDRDRVLVLALLDDLAEAEAGDPPPYDPADLPPAGDAGGAPGDAERRRAFLERRQVRSLTRQAAKRAAEAAAMTSLLADLPPPLAAEMGARWAELEDGATPEARFVKQADKLETYLQSREYRAADPSRPVASFAAEVAEVVTDPSLAALRDAVSRMETDGAGTDP